MTAASQLFYNDGLISTDTGSPADPRKFIGNGTLWAVEGAPLVYAGDTLFVPGHDPLPIVEVTDNDHLTTGLDYTGDALEDSEYFILYTSPLRYQQFALASAIRAQINRNSVFDAASPVFSITTFMVNDPPDDAVVGDRYVVGSSPTGEFTGHRDEIAERTETGWLFRIPDHGWSVIDEDENLVHLWSDTQWLSAAGLGASITDEGDWQNDITYTPGQVVTHLDEVWISRTTNLNSEPSIGSSDWRLFLALGIDGGAFTLRYQFSTDTNNSDPGSGKVKFNAGSDAVSLLRISRYDAHGNDWGSLIASIGTSTTSVQKGKIRVVTKGDLSRQWIGTVMSVTAVGAPDYYNLTISSPTPSSAALQDAADVLFMFQERGDVGLQGVQGNTGPRGFAGGPVAISYVADLSSTENSDPGQGKLRFGSVPQNGATVLRVDGKSSTGMAVDTLLASLATASTSDIKAAARLFDRDDDTKFLTFNITGVDASTEYRNLTIVITGSSAANPFVTDGNLVLTWVPKGDKGDAGTIEVGAVTTGAPGSSASVTNVGSEHSAVLDITIPRGNTGDNFTPQHVVAELVSSESPPADDRSTYDAGPVFDDAGVRLSVLVLSDSTNDDKPTLYFLETAATEEDAAVWSAGVTFGVAPQAASEISFDGEESGLEATDVQGAVDEVAADVGDIPDPVAMALILGTDNVKGDKGDPGDPGGVTAVAGLTGDVSAEGLKTALEITASDVSGATTMGKAIAAAMIFG